MATDVVLGLDNGEGVYVLTGGAVRLYEGITLLVGLTRGEGLYVLIAERVCI